jgi:hypothetical protein
MRVSGEERVEEQRAKGEMNSKRAKGDGQRTKMKISQKGYPYI